MKLEKHVLRAIEAFRDGHKDEALLHACFAIDGTARKLSNTPKSSAKTYKKCLRNYLWLLDFFMGPGPNLSQTKWTNLNLQDGNGKKIESPDIADVVYHIFRCSSAHAEEIPINYDLLPVIDDQSCWRLNRGGKLQMPERIIWSLLAVNVFSEVNKDIKTEGDYFLSWGSDILPMGTTKFIIKDSWGKENEIKDFSIKNPLTKITLKNL